MTCRDQGTHALIGAAAFSLTRSGPQHSVWYLRMQRAGSPSRPTSNSAGKPGDPTCSAIQSVSRWTGTFCTRWSVSNFRTPLHFDRHTDATAIPQHEELPYEPVHPAIYLNAALRDRAPLHSSRIASSFEPSEVNYGNTSASAFYRDSRQGSWRCGTVWRRAPEAGGRATAVGWGSFSPLPVDARPKNDKGKEREVDLETPLPTEDGRIRTGVEPLLTTTTPILQLQLASLPDPGRLLLACRSQTALDLMLLDSEPASSAGLPAPLSHYRYPSSAFNACPVADVALGGIAPGYGEAGSGLVVDAEGALFGFGLGGSAGPTRAGEPPEMFRLRRGRRKKRSDGLARVAWGGIRGLDAVVGLVDEVLLYDLRSPTSSTTLVDGDILKRHPSWDTPGPARITSLLSRSPTHPLSASSSCPTPIHVVCTTRDVLWLDERMPGREVLRWHHGRAGIEGKGSDTTLSLIEVPSLDTSSASEGTVQRVALHSRLHPQIDIFTTELAPAKAPRTLLEPYSICPPPSRRAEGPSEAFERTRAGLSLVACRTDQGNEAGEAALGQEAMQVDLAQDSSSDEEEGATAKHGAGRGDRERDRRRLTWRILEVGSRGELESWEACAARDGDAFARSEEEYEAAALPVYGPASGLHRAVGGSVTRQRRKRLDTRALLAALEADQRVLDEPDELRLGGKIGAVNLFAPEQVDSGQADVGALTRCVLAHDVVPGLARLIRPRSQPRVGHPRSVGGWLVEPTASFAPPLASSLRSRQQRGGGSGHGRECSGSHLSATPRTSNSVRLPDGALPGHRRHSASGMVSGK